MKKISTQITLSFVVSSLVFSPALALPSGGKFSHGTSGSINTNGNVMNVIGNNKNSVIQWGGGFSINQGEKVNFGNDKFNGQQNYLNIAHGASKSFIKGTLDGGNNNVFLINPNGIIIEKGGQVINTNRFVAAASSMRNEDMIKFAGLRDNEGLSFSPVFKPSNGNVVNMGGKISANNLSLYGNKIVLNAYADFTGSNHPEKISADKINLQGNEVYVDLSGIDGKRLQNISVFAQNEGSMHLNASGYFYNPDSYLVFNKLNKEGNFEVYKYIGIGSDVDWWHFAKGWNENKADFRTLTDFKLTKDISFNGNYANYCIGMLNCTNMIIGNNALNSFDKNFDGQGYTLSGINIDIQGSANFAGVFGSLTNGAKISNVDVNYNGRGIFVKNDTGDNRGIGGFVGSIIGDGVQISNISLKGINEIKSDSNAFHMGGFVGLINGSASFNNILIEGIANITNNTNYNAYGTGGFVGSAYNDVSFINIHLKNVNSIKGYNVGGFVGNVKDHNLAFNQISILNKKAIIASSNRGGGFVGGFIGDLNDNKHMQFSNISLSGFGKITGSSTGGFAGELFAGNYQAIAIENIGLVEGLNTGGFAGTSAYNNANNEIFVSNIYINGIDSITAKDGSQTNAGGFIGYIGNSGGIKNTFNDITIEGIKNIKTIGGDSLDGLGGFIGQIASNRNGKIDFTNINLFFDTDFTMTKGNTEADLIIGRTPFINNTKITFNDMNFYYANNTFNGAGNKGYNGVSINKYQTNEQETKYNEFKTKDKTTKPTISEFSSNEKTELKLVNAKDIKNEIAILSENDLFEETIQKEIIEYITKKYYFVDINTLNDLLIAYDKLISNSSKEARIKFIQENLLVSKNYQEAKEVVESLDFLTIYKTNGLSTAEKDGILDDNAKLTNNLMQAKINKTLAYEQELIGFLRNKLDDLNNNANSFLKDFINNEKALKEAIKEYNFYVALINAKEVEKDEVKLNILKQRIDDLLKQSVIFSTKIKNKESILKQWQTQAKNDSNGHFIILGDYTHSSLKPILDEITGDGGIDPEIPKPIDPTTPIDPIYPVEVDRPMGAYFYDDLSVLDEEENEIGEKYTPERLKICIVNNNFKTMNPCAVEIMQESF